MKLKSKLRRAALVASGSVLFSALIIRWSVNLLRFKLVGR